MAEVDEPTVFKRAMKRIKDKLYAIDLENTNLMTKLDDLDVITNAKSIASIKAGATNFDKVDKLLEILERCPNDRFPLFLDALTESDQKHIRFMLEDNLERSNNTSAGGNGPPAGAVGGAPAAATAGTVPQNAANIGIRYPIQASQD